MAVTAAAAPPCSVQLTRQLSASRCELNATYGCGAERRTMWTKGGCRGIFSCDGENDIDCEATLCNCKPPPEHRGLLSRTLGSGMVLQRDTDAAVVWGYAGAGVSVTVTLDGKDLGAPAHPDANGTWRQRLPSTPGGGPHTIVATASSGATQALTDVQFGDVFLCGGQSNMEFAMPSVTNATAEIAAADSYNRIRLFTVGTATQGQPGQAPLYDLQTVQQPWVVANSSTVGSDGVHYTQSSHTCATASDGWLDVLMYNINLLKFIKARSAKTTDSIYLNATGCVFGTTRRVWCVFCRLLAVREGDCRPNWCRHPNRPGLKQLRCGKRPFKTETHGIQFKQLMIYQDRLGTHIGKVLKEEKRCSAGGTIIEKWLPPEELAACETAGRGGNAPPLPPLARNKTYVDSRLWCANIFVAPFVQIVECHCLPRQARDKHRESWKGENVSAGAR